MAKVNTLTFQRNPDGSCVPVDKPMSINQDGIKFNVTHPCKIQWETPKNIGTSDFSQAWSDVNQIFINSWAPGINIRTGTPTQQATMSTKQPGLLQRTPKILLIILLLLLIGGGIGFAVFKMKKTTTE